jgi:prepilin-type processing-associated H-X9-DG protein
MFALCIMLTALVVPRLYHERSKSFQAACMSNLRQWGLAIRMYADDHNQTYYYNAAGVNWDDRSSPYLPYISAANNTTWRRLKLCPARAAKMTEQQMSELAVHNYSMPIPTYKENGSVYYRAVGADSPFVDAHGDIWPTLRFLRAPAKYLLLIESNGRPFGCGDLKNTVNGVPLNDTVRAIARHRGIVNCLFGDCHVEAVPYQTICEQDVIDCNTGNTWFMMN